MNRPAAATDATVSQRHGDETFPAIPFTEERGSTGSGCQISDLVGLSGGDSVRLPARDDGAGHGHGTREGPSQMQGGENQTRDAPTESDGEKYIGSDADVTNLHSTDISIIHVVILYASGRGYLDRKLSASLSVSIT